MPFEHLARTVVQSFELVTRECLLCGTFDLLCPVELNALFVRFLVHVDEVPLRVVEQRLPYDFFVLGVALPPIESASSRSSAEADRRAKLGC